MGKAFQNSSNIEHSENILNNYGKPNNINLKIKGLKNIWATIYFTKSGPMYVNIIQTDTKNSQPPTRAKLGGFSSRTWPTK